MSNWLWPCGLKPSRLLCPWNSPGRNTGVGCHALLQGIFLPQGLNPHLLCCLHWQVGSLLLKSSSKPNEWVKGTQSCLTLFNPMDYTVHGNLQARILQWIAFPLPGGSSQPKDRTQVFHIACRLFTTWVIREAQEHWSGYPIPSPVAPDPGIKPGSPALQVDSLPTGLSGKPMT